MADLAVRGDSDLLTHWMGQSRPVGRPRRRRPDELGLLRFAFYGRVSTADFQERDSSRRWQRDVADDLVTGHGRIVAEYFDADRSRRLPWRDRPQAALLLAAIADPDRGFDAVVVGEYEPATAAQRRGTQWSPLAGRTAVHCGHAAGEERALLGVRFSMRAVAAFTAPRAP